MGYEWTGMAYQEKQVGGQALLVFGMAVLLVYLVLAAQYESWFIPAAVILVVPLGLLGAVAAVSLRGLDNNLYTQIGIVLIIALASKNAILIVEFARDIRAAGETIREAAIEAAAAAVPADSDDFVRVHPGRGSAGDRHRSGGGGPAGFGHGGVRRDDRARPCWRCSSCRCFIVVFQNLAELWTGREKSCEPSRVSGRVKS